MKPSLTMVCHDFFCFKTKSLTLTPKNYGENPHDCIICLDSCSALPGGLLPVGSNGFYKACLMALLCVVGAALAAGLTMGLVSIDPMEMVTRCAIVPESVDQLPLFP